MKPSDQRILPAPIRKEVRVHASQQQAFDTFAARMGQWWLKGHSLLQAPQADVIIEPKVGGRWFEVGADGSEQTWGRVLEWSAPHRMVLAWQLTAEWEYDPDFETVIEVRFEPDGDHTLVRFEHRDLDRFAARSGRIPDDFQSGMDAGWAALLDSFRTLADAGRRQP